MRFKVLTATKLPGRARTDTVPGRSRGDDGLTSNIEPAVVSATMRIGAGGNVDERTFNALRHSQVIDLTTTGRRSGQPRRIEIFLHEKVGLLFITGVPRADRTRDWIHNVTADPQVIVHLKQSIAVDIPATARVVTDPAERRPLMAAAAQRWGRTDVDEMVRHSPLIVLTVANADERRKLQ